MTGSNTLMIVVHPRRFEIRPAPEYPEVEFFEPVLKVWVDWSDNRGAWSKISVCNFAMPASCTATSATVKAADPPTIHKVDFTFDVPHKELCKFEVHYHPTGNESEPYILDPGLKLKP